MAKQVVKQKTVKIRIPIDPLNPSIKTITPIVNGKSYQIELGKDVEIPENVYQVLINSGRI
jgi:hypothetical protein